MHQKPKITYYSFGKIVVGEETYRKDIIILPDGHVEYPWWRRKGHGLAIDDLAVVLEANPSALVVGTGVFGVMSVPEHIAAFLAEKGIELVALPTKQAVREFNSRIDNDERVAGALHLTC